MDFYVFCGIDKIVKQYTDAYMLGNSIPNLDVVLTASVTKEQKEHILNDLDDSLRDYVDFSHEYENGRLEITFKEATA